MFVETVWDKEPFAVYVLSDVFVSRFASTENLKESKSLNCSETLQKSVPKILIMKISMECFVICPLLFKFVIRTGHWCIQLF